MKDSKFEQWATRMYMRNCEERILHKKHLTRTAVPTLKRTWTI